MTRPSSSKRSYLLCCLALLGMPVVAFVLSRYHPSTATIEDIAHRDLQASTSWCLAREMVDFNDQFDAVAYKNMVLSDAGVSEEDIWKTKNMEGSVASFHQTPVAQDLLTAIEQHSELHQIGRIVTACREEANGRVSAIGTGTMVGSLLAQALQGESFNQTSGPLQTAGCDTYLGFHVEFGLLLDGSWAFLPQGTRGCIGLELGGGFEFSLIVLVLDSNLPPGPAYKALFDLDLAPGLAVGVAAGVGQFEFTIGGGIGGGIGAAICRSGPPFD